ncbi:putative peptidyl-serine phosphorylation [Lyophyllum shimeji]|uniref:Peptidyl-serine phosphorylation n=1 Tax=Lyophyllum shimeji TaxID=47721 RepID=A0A9P3PXR7_LYOSH|nr:putative peptidyl-serine phosphorylation [Lyophyllum shimeji]
MQFFTPSKLEASVPSDNEDLPVRSGPVAPTATRMPSSKPRVKMLWRRHEIDREASIKTLEDNVARLEATIRELESGPKHESPVAKLCGEIEQSAFLIDQPSHRSPTPVAANGPSALAALKALAALDPGLIATSEGLADKWYSSRTIPPQLLAHDIRDISPYPFAMTPASNISRGTMASTPVALKAPRRSQTQPVTEEETKRFFFEGLVSSTANHSNVSPVLGMHIGSSGDLFLVSELMKNGSLPEYLAAHPGANKLALLSKVADAVAHLHSLPTPVLHGDIRGHNVLVDDEGEPRLIDFGFALVMDPVTGEFSPASHAFIGNPRWTPSEKIRPSEYPLTLKADCYSFASLMLEVFSGDVPYRNSISDGAVIIEVLVRKNIPARPDTPELTDSLWNLMKQCWSLDPAARPSMDEIHRALLAEMAAMS